MSSPTKHDRPRVGRPPGPTPDPEARREEILDAAERVIKAQGPDVGMSDIAAGIGLTKPAVYRSVGDKAELSAALGRRVAERLAGQLGSALAGPGEVRQVVAAAIDVFCTFVDEETNLYRFIVHGSVGTRHTGLQDKPLVTRLGQEISSALGLALERAGVDAGDPPGAGVAESNGDAGWGGSGGAGDAGLADTWAYAILGAVFSSTEHWRRRRHIPRDQFVDQLTRLVTPALEQLGVAPA